MKMITHEETLLGGGADLTGRQVQYWGDAWTVTGLNFVGDWDVERFEPRDTGSVKVTASIDPWELEETHPHYAKLLPTH